MKAVILFVFIFTTVWALPKVPNAPPKSLPVETSVKVLPNEVVPRIINGSDAYPHSIPYQVNLVVLSSGIGGWTCGGSLISPIHVLTSAHCITSSLGVYVHLGVHDIDERETNHIVLESKNLIIHDDYNESTNSNDIGLIVLKEPVELNEYINVVTLPPRNINTDYTGYNATVSGWGITSAQGNRTSFLQVANVTVISNVACRQVFSTINDSQLCALGNRGETTCDGDTGGPLVVNNTQIGIVSFGTRGCNGNLPSGYTRTSSFLNWIEDNTGLKL